MLIGSIFSPGYCPKHGAPKSSNLKCLLLRFITAPDFPDHPFPPDFAEFKLDNAKEKAPKGLWTSTEALTSIDTTNYGLNFSPAPDKTNDKTMVVRAFTSSSPAGERMVLLKLDIRNNGEVIKYEDERDGSLINLRVKIGVSWKVDPQLPNSSAVMSGADIKKLVRDGVIVAFNDSAELTETPSAKEIMNSPTLTQQSLASSALGLGTFTIRMAPKDST